MLIAARFRRKGEGAAVLARACRGAAARAVQRRAHGGHAPSPRHRVRRRAGAGARSPSRRGAVPEAAQQKRRGGCGEVLVLRDPVVHGGRSRGSGLHERRSEMKTCPTCGARAFDDAEVCFGCLHRYGEEPVRPNIAMPTMPSSPGTGHCPTLRPKAAPAEPKPPQEAPPRDGAGWTVRFELPGYAPVMEADGREGGVVVRFQPSDEVGGAGDGGRRVPRGTHARDAPSENRASASAAGRS